MNSKATAAILIIALLAAGLVVGIFAARPVHSLLPAGNSNVSSGTQNRTGTLFSATKYWSYAYLISGNATPPASGRAATSDFHLADSALGNGSVEYTMTFSSTGAAYNVTVGPGEKLYYIDMTLADDSNNYESFPGDDGYAVVNASGYAVSIKFPLNS